MSELRALEVFSTVPAGCILRPVTNDDSDPHLRAGEFAVVDTNDTDAQNGELYLIRWSCGKTDVVQAFTREHYHPAEGTFTGWWTRCLRRLDFDIELAKARRNSRPGQIVSIPRGTYVDGPRRKEGFEKALIGRVIGIYQAAEALPAAMKQIGGRAQ